MQPSREFLLADKAVIAAAWLVLLFAAERLSPAARSALGPGREA